MFWFVDFEKIRVDPTQVTTVPTEGAKIPLTNGPIFLTPELELEFLATCQSRSPEVTWILLSNNLFLNEPDIAELLARHANSTQLNQAKKIENMTLLFMVQNWDLHVY
jgi:hypothetical protein